MTQPHRYIENQFAKLSRGTLHGLPLLMPGKGGNLAKQIREIFLLAARRFNIQLLALNVEPFGYVAVIFDPQMRRSDFLKSVNQSISMKVKKAVKHEESVWSNKKPGNIPILDLETLENEIFQTCIRPVKKGYVRKVSDWVLPTIGPSDWPELKSENNLDVVVSVGDSPNASLGQGPGLFRALVDLKQIGHLKTILNDRIDVFQRSEKRRRRKVLSKTACLNRATFLHSSATNREEYARPNVPFLCASKIAFDLAVQGLKDFHFAYRQALENFPKKKTVIFPFGVLKMRTLFGVAVSPAKASDVFRFRLR